ncbi:MAG: DUF3616 domain-containing protein [Cyanobacteria bacterium P01_G01_bin.49]
MTIWEDLVSRYKSTNLETVVSELGEKNKIEKLKNINFDGRIHEDKDISAIISFGNFLAIGSDESKRKIQILEKKQEQEAIYKVKKKLEIELPVLAENDDEEIDIEGMSISDEKTLFVIGSHSLKRSKIKSDKTYEENRKRLTKVIYEDKKNSIFVLTLDSQTGKEKNEKQRKIIRIKEIIENNSILGLFNQIPSKENGVDIEEIASKGNTLYIGFRGPVLRDNYVPIMVIKDFEDVQNESDYELRFVDLKGNGIRDITKVKDGFLIIAGPVSDGLASYELYFWNGVDGIPGRDKPEEIILISLGKIPTSDNAKAEGITVIKDIDDCCQFIIIYDGLLKGNPTLFQIKNPWK